MVGFLVGLVPILPISPTTRLRLVDNVSFSRSDASGVPTAMDVIHEISRNMVIATVNGEFIVTRYADVYRGRIVVELRTLNKPQLLGEAENMTLQTLMACIVVSFQTFSFRVQGATNREEQSGYTVFIPYIVTYFQNLGPGTGWDPRAGYTHEIIEFLSTVES